MDEYVKFYIENLLLVEELPLFENVPDEYVPKGKMVWNDISAINYETALQHIQNITIKENKKDVKLTKSLFIELIHDIPVEGIDAEELWKLCVLLYFSISQELVAVTNLTEEDEYMRFFNALLKKMDISSIEIKGKINGKGKIFTITHEKIIDKMLDGFLALQSEMFGKENYDYTLSHFCTLEQFSDKRKFDYMFAKELEAFLLAFLNLQEKGLSGTHKKMILTILYLFGRLKDDFPITTDNYRKLMSDGKKMGITKASCFVGGKLLPFIIEVNPEAIKIRREFCRLVHDKCEK